MILSFVIGIVIAIHLRSRMSYQDEIEWTGLAASIVNHGVFGFDGVHPTSSRPPGFALFIAIPELFHLPIVGLRIFNISAFLAAQLFLYRIVRNIASPAAAAVAAMLSLTCPIFLYSSTLLFPQTLGSALLLAIVWAMTDVYTVRRTLLAGTASAALFLTIPTFIPSVILLFAWQLCRRQDLRRLVIALLAPIIVLLGGWSIRNYVVMHEIVPVATNGGVNLLISYSENATSSSGSYTDIEAYIHKAWAMPEGDGDRFLRQTAYAWIKRNPARALKLYVHHLILVFSWRDGPAPDKMPASTLQQAVMFLTYEPLLGLLLFRLVLAARYPLSEVETCVIGLYLTNAVVSAIFFPRIRFREPADWLLIVSAIMSFRVFAASKWAAKWLNIVSSIAVEGQSTSPIDQNFLEPSPDSKRL